MALVCFHVPGRWQHFFSWDILTWQRGCLLWGRRCRRMAPSRQQSWPSTTTGCLCPMTWPSWAANTGPGSSPVSQEIPNPHCKWTWFIPDAHRFNDSESCSLKMGFTAQSRITFQRKTWTPLSAKNQWGFSKFISVRILCRSNYSVLLESWFCFSAEENVKCQFGMMPFWQRSDSIRKE